MPMSLRISRNQIASKTTIPRDSTPENTPIHFSILKGKENFPFPYPITSFLPSPRRSHKTHSQPAFAGVTPRWVTLAICILLFLTACGAKNETLERIQQTEVLRVAIDPSFAPFEYINDDNELVGYDVDLATEIAEALEVEVHFVSTGYDALYDTLTVSRADIIISALYPDPSRTQNFVFSTPYFNAGDVLIVADSSITSWTSLDGKRLACLFGTTGHMIALEWQKSINPSIIAAQSPVTLKGALADGNLDAVIIDHITALNITKNADIGHILPEMITDEPYAIASRIEDGELIQAVDKILTQLESDGTLMRLTEKWIHNLP
jgi:polar amino acid transport system substrate-binding protein